MPLSTGARIGPYVIIAPLGAGGMGEVYRARDPRLGREVALKVLPATFARDADRLARFEREARAAAALNHQNIVTLFSIEEADGTRFLTMELVEGQSLRDLVTAGGLPLQRVLDLALPLAEALAAAHAKGVIHRDLKPANVMVAADGRVKVLDFGLAKLSGTSPAADGLTHAETMEAALSGAGTVLGTLPYMAPEQLRGEAADARTDLFAFGIVLYELATGRRPFVGSTPAEVSSTILRDPPAPLSRVRPDLPANLGRIIERCLEKAPADRFQRALEVENELRLLRRTLERGTPTHGKAAGGPSIAVLPFSNMSADPENEYFSDGLTEELLNVLAKVPDLKVTGRTSSFAFKGKLEDLREIGQRLGVSTLLEGSVRKAGNRVRITAQLIKVEDGFHLWSETYDRVLDDIFAVQDDIARSVSSALHVTLLGKSGTAARGGVDTYSRILQANHLVRQNSPEAVARAIELYREAIELTPGDARAWSGLARGHANQAFYDHADVDGSRAAARTAIDKAIVLDPDLADAREVSAMILANLEFRFEEADRELRLAMALTPGASGPMATAAFYATCFGRVAEARELARRAREIDPLNPVVHSHQARIESGAGNLDAAAEAYARVLDLAPGIAQVHASLGLIRLRQGRSDEAIAEMQKEPTPGYRDYALAIAYHKLGRPEESDAALKRLLSHGPQWAFQVAVAYAGRDQTDEAFHWLERAYDLRDSGIVSTRWSPLLVPLHSDPRWPVFLKKIGLER